MRPAASFRNAIAASSRDTTAPTSRRCRMRSCLRALGGAALATAFIAAAPSPADAQTPGQEDRALQRLAAESLARDSGISLQEAEQRLKLQDEAAVALDGVDALLGESFAGTWFADRDRGRLKIGVVDGRPGRENVAQVRARLAERGVAGQSDFVAVRSTLKELEAAQQDPSGSLAALVADGKVSIGIKPSDNAVAIKAIEGLTPAEEGVLAAAAAASPVKVTVDKRSVGSLTIRLERDKSSPSRSGSGSACSPS